VSSNKTIIVTLTRTGSTYLNLKLAVEKQLYSFGEILNHRSTFFDEKFEKDFDVQLDNLNEDLKNKYIFDTWKKCSNSVCRLVPNQTKDKSLVEKYLQNADNIIYHYRKDITAQVYSTIIAKETKQFSADRKKFNKEITLLEFEEMSKRIQDRYLNILELYKKFPGKISCLENYPPKPFPKNYLFEKKFKYDLINIDNKFKKIQEHT